MPDNPRPARSYRIFGDVWFAVLPVWSIPIYSFPIFHTMAHGITGGHISRFENPGLFWTLFVALFAMGLSAFWCCWQLDGVTKSWNKLKWYCVVLLLAPFGSTICYFWKLRDGR